MKIVQVLSTVAGGGAEVFATDLCIELSKIPNNIIYVLTYHEIFDDKGRELKKQLEATNIEYIKVPQGRGIMKFLKPVWGFKKEIKNIQPDIVHVHHLAPSIIIAFLKVIGIIKAKTVITLHNATRLPRIPYFLLPFFFKQYNRIVSCSDFVKSHFPYKPLLPRIISIPNGINLERIKKDKDSLPKNEWRKKVGLSAENIVFINIGSAIYLDGKADTIKGHRLMISSMEKIEESNFNTKIKILFLGGGPFQKNIVREIVDRRLETVIQMPGLVNDPYPYIFAADFVLMPSYSEGLSIAMIECVCSGLPAIVSPHAAFAPFKSSSLFSLSDWDAKELADKIKYCADNQSCMKAQAEANVGYFMNMFDIVNVARKYFTLFQSVLPNANPNQQGERI